MSKAQTNPEGDVYFKKVVSLNVSGHALQFRVAQDLFSSQEVDVGTQRLLRSLMEQVASRPLKVLDLGCGYGPLGLAVQVIDPQSVVHLVDRDALAVEYSQKNAAYNHLIASAIYGSLGYDDVTETDFDLVISNIPGKAGEPVIASFLQDAAGYLKPGGNVAVVVVAPLEPLVMGILSVPGIDITFQKQWRGHTVFHYHFTEAVQEESRQTALERGVYTRNATIFPYQNLHLPMQTAFGLPEFDTLSYRSELLLQGVRENRGEDLRRVLVLNPNQGHVPVVLWKWFHPESITLVDRDLLSLRYSLRNILDNECPAESVILRYQPGVPVPEMGQVDLIAYLLREEEGPKALAETIGEAMALLASNGRMLVAGSSTAITRLQESIQSSKLVQVKDRQRSRGESLLVLRRK